MDKELIKICKNAAEIASIPPKFNPDEWKGKEFNCYAYALRICVDFKSYYNREIVPGFLSIGKNESYRDGPEAIVKLFKQDCQVLNLQVTETNLNEPTNENEYKVAVYACICRNYRDFHFIRQDSNGNWSHKRGWLNPIETYMEEDILKNFGIYEFVNMYKLIKKE